MTDRPPPDPAKLLGYWDTVADRLFTLMPFATAPIQNWFEAMSHYFSPYELNPLNINASSFSNNGAQGIVLNPLSPASTDVHGISSQSGTDSVDPGLPARGGYNYQITLNSPGHVQVYNAVFGPPSPSVSSLPAMLPLYIGAALLLVFALLASRERARDTSPLKRESSIP